MCIIGALDTDRYAHINMHGSNVNDKTTEFRKKIKHLIKRLKNYFLGYIKMCLIKGYKFRIVFDYLGT